MNKQTSSLLRHLTLTALLWFACGHTALATLTVTSLAPSNNAAGVCYDTPLYIAFNETPKVGSSGAVRIYTSTNDTIPVDVIDLSLGNLQSRTFSGDAQSFNVYSVLVSGTTARIYPHAGVMNSNQTYYVTVDPDVFTDAADTPFAGITDTNAWRFTTKAEGPANPTLLLVTADGTGDFVTVQGAVNSLPEGNTTPAFINIRDGDYVELVNISGKHNILLRGESREGTIIGYANNATIAPGGTTHARMAFKVNGNDIAIDNLTITNRTPQGGSQAEALMLETDVRRFIANNVKIASYQDTILANTSGTQGYFYHSLVQGDVDFIWGGGNLYFTNCEIRSLRSSSAITQPRTAQGSNGMAFVKCRLTRSPGIANVQFARSLNLATSSMYGNAAFVWCLIDAHIIGWEYYIESPRVALRWWEYGNSNLTGTAAVQYNGRQLGGAGDDPRLDAVTNATTWLYGWVPQLSPNITSQPQGQSVLAGQTAILTVAATGIPDPHYQWQKDGSNLVGETEATLSIPNAQLTDGGDYSVIVSNVAGVATSSPASLVVETPVPPTITNPVALSNGDFQLTLGGASGQPFRLWASTNAAFSPVTDTWTLLSNGVFGVGPVEYIDSQIPAPPQRFYLITVP